MTLRWMWTIMVEGREVEIDLLTAFYFSLLKDMNGQLSPSTKGIAALDDLGLLRRDDVSGNFVLSERGAAVRQANEQLLTDAMWESLKAFMIAVPKEDFEAKLAEVLAKMGMTFDMLRTLASRH